MVRILAGLVRTLTLLLSGSALLALGVAFCSGRGVRLLLFSRRDGTC